MWNMGDKFNGDLDSGVYWLDFTLLEVFPKPDDSVIPGGFYVVALPE